MADCDLIGGCIFFNDKMRNMPATAEILKNKYCRDNSSPCARYMVFKALGRERVPADLFPQQQDKAENIIKNG